MRAFISKKSRVPCVFSPSATIRASPTTSRRNSSWPFGKERWEPENGWTFASNQAFTSSGTGAEGGGGMCAGGAGSEGDEGAESLPQPAPSATSPVSAAAARRLDTRITISFNRSLDSAPECRHRDPRSEPNEA